MTNLKRATAACAIGLLAGCQTPNDTLNAEQQSAVQTAVARAKFEMNCPDASGSVISRNLINPAVNGPVAIGVERAEYTIGVSGCGQRQVYISVCQIGSVSCVSARGRE